MAQGGRRDAGLRPGDVVFKPAGGQHALSHLEVAEVPRLAAELRGAAALLVQLSRVHRLVARAGPLAHRLRRHLGALVHQLRLPGAAVGAGAHAVRHALLQPQQQPRAPGVNAAVAARLRAVLLQRRVDDPEELQRHVDRHLAHGEHKLLQRCCIREVVAELDDHVRELWQVELDSIQRRRVLDQALQLAGYLDDGTLLATLAPQ